MQNSNPQNNETITWSGSCANGYVDGKGTLLWFKNNQPNGKSVGVMRDGKYEEIWQHTLVDGFTYEGMTVNGRMQGKAKAKWANGIVYEGALLMVRDLDSER